MKLGEQAESIVTDSEKMSGCQCGPGCSCGCQSGGSCQCGGGCS